MMPVVFYDEEDCEQGDDYSATAMFLVCFELAVIVGMVYMMRFAD